jgi:predicted transcriptional regulator of viral defense system
VVADAIFRDAVHYITTDAALEAEGLIDQPVPVITVVVRKKTKPVKVGRATVRAVWMAESRLAEAGFNTTSREGYEVSLATPAQALVDGLAQPEWMTHRTLLPEVLVQLPPRDVETAADAALLRSKAAAARLGYLIEEARLPVPRALETFAPVSRTELTPGRRGPYSTRWRVYGW